MCTDNQIRLSDCWTRRDATRLRCMRRALVICRKDLHPAVVCCRRLTTQPAAAAAAAAWFIIYVDIICIYGRLHLSGVPENSAHTEHISSCPQSILYSVTCPFRPALASPAMGLWGHVPPSTSNSLFFSVSLCTYKSMKAISHVRCLLDFAYATVIKISLFFIISKKNYKGVSVFL